MKIAIKRFLHKKGLYYPVKYSRLFHLYQLLFKPKEIKQQRQEVVFYKSFLPACKLIFDIGAYDGHKTEAFLAVAEKVVCCEPDSENFKILNTRFSTRKKKVFLENIALADKEGIAEMHIHHAGSAFNTLSSKWKKLLEDDNRQKWDEPIKFIQTQTTKTTTLDRLIDKYGVPDFIKIDAEGFEHEILKGLSQRIHYLTFETLLPDYENELWSCIAHISGLDHSATYNICRCEKLLLPGFVSKDELASFLNNNKVLIFEVVVKMSAPGSLHLKD